MEGFIRYVRDFGFYLECVEKLLEDFKYMSDIM